MKKNLFAALLAAVLCLATLPASAMALEWPSDGSKTVTIYSTDGTDAIQTAIDAIAASSDSEGWTITVKAGTYDRFTVPHGLKNLTIQGDSKTAVVIKTLETAATNGLRDSGGINVFGINTVLKNLTVTAGAAASPSFTGAISAHDGAAGGSDVSLTVENCVITGSGVGDGILLDCPSFNVRNCEISGFVQAIEFYGDNYIVPADGIEITGNTISNCSFAIHGYFGGGEGGGVMTIANNTVSGTDELRTKVVVQDNTASDDGAIKADVRDNIFVNTVVGLVNLRGEGETLSDVLASNTMGISSYYVEAVEPGTIEFYSQYNAPEGSSGHWVLTGIDDVEVNWGNNPEGSLTYIKSQIDAANAAGSHTLTITGIPDGELVKSFTWFKDAVYWVSAEKESEPGMDKKVETTTGDEIAYQDTIGNVASGSVLTFTLNSNLPTSLALKVGTNGQIPATVQSSLVFYDKMTNLEYAGNLSVTIGETVLPEGSYTVAVAESKDYFTVTLDLVKLFNGGVITLDQLKNAAPAVVRYDAKVTGAAGASLNNEAWVNDSAHDITPGNVPGGKPTGGMGTTMFTAGGAVLLVMAGALYLATYKRREQI